MLIFSYAPYGLAEGLELSGMMVAVLVRKQLLLALQKWLAVYDNMPVIRVIFFWCFCSRSQFDN